MLLYHPTQPQPANKTQSSDASSLSEKPVKHIHCVTHEGKVVLVGTDEDGGLWYTVKQDGFEDNYLEQTEEFRTGWEDWKKLALPGEEKPDGVGEEELDKDESVADREAKTLNIEENKRALLSFEEGNEQGLLLRSLYKSNNKTAAAPVQLVSALGHLYVFRQSMSGTLLVDRFVLDGMTNELTRKLEVRFKRSRQKDKPIDSQRKGSTGLVNVDALDFTDISGKPFYEPTTELLLLNHLKNGWFSVVFLPTAEQDKYRWHIFAYSGKAEVGVVEVTTIRASEEGLFDVHDYTIFDPDRRVIPGVIRQSFSLKDVSIAHGLSATRYDVQRESINEQGEAYLLREAVKVMLVVGTSDDTVAALSFSVAADGTLSAITDVPKHLTEERLRGDIRDIQLPVDTLNNIRAISQAQPRLKGRIKRFSQHIKNNTVLANYEIDQPSGDSEDQPKREFSLDRATEIEISNSVDANQVFSSIQRIDEHTFKVPLQAQDVSWEEIPAEEAAVVFNGMVTAYEVVDNQLKVTAFNHGLSDGDEVQVVGIAGYEGRHNIAQIDDETFCLDGVKWQAGSVVNITSLKNNDRGGITFDGEEDRLEITIDHTPPTIFTYEFWCKSEHENAGLISIRDNDSKYELDIYLENGKLYAQSNMTADIEVDLGSIDSYQSHDYHHIAYTTRHTVREEILDITGVLYIDGKERSRSNIFSASVRRYKHRAGKDITRRISVGYAKTSSTSVERGLAERRWGDALSLNGIVSDLRVWSTALSEEEIKNRMYVPLLGREKNLVGYWPLNAIVNEDGDRKVLDASIHHRDGIVHGDPFVSASQLKRLLAEGYSAEAFENDELFSVVEGATYEEEFECRTDNKLDLTQNAIFKIVYKGKKNRSSKNWDFEAEADNTGFEELNGEWFKAKAKVTIPQGVSLLRVFAIKVLQNNGWETLNIRKHRIYSTSNTISLQKREIERLELAALGQDRTDIKNLSNEIRSLELQEAIILREKEKVEEKKYFLENKVALEAEVEATETELATIRNDIKTLEQQISTEESKRITIYEHAGYGGNSTTLGQGDHPLYSKWSGAVAGGWWNDRISSLKVPDGLKATLYKDWLGGGDWTYTSDSGYVGKWMNDETSSIKVEFTPENQGIYDRRKEDLADKKAKEPDVAARLEEVKKNLQDFDKPIDLGPQILSLFEQLEELEALKRDWGDWKQKTKSYKPLSKVSELLDELIKLEERGLTLTEPERFLKRLFYQYRAKPEGFINALNDYIASIQSGMASKYQSYKSSVKLESNSKLSEMKSLTPEQDLETKGSILNFVRPAGYLNLMETCEGNVQLSYFDDQDQLRHVNYDAVNDDKNDTFDCWVPRLLKTCLNFSSNIPLGQDNIPLGQEDNSTQYAYLQREKIAKREEATIETNSIFLRDEWTVEAWFHYPLPTTNKWNTLVGDREGKNSQIVVHSVEKAGKRIQILGTRMNGLFYPGVELNSLNLSPGWHHIAARWHTVDQSIPVIDFHVDGDLRGSKPLDGFSIDQDSYGELDPNLIPSGTDLTVSFWLKLAHDTPEKSIAIFAEADKEESGSPDWRTLVIDLPYEGKVRFHCGGSDSSSTPTDWIQKEVDVEILKDNWTHWAFTKNVSEGKMVIYKNGELIHQEEGKSQTIHKSARFLVGKNIYDEHLHGRISGLTILDKALSKAKIAAEAKKSRSEMSGNIEVIGNVAGGAQSFGRLAEVRIWDVALSDEEIAANSKTLLSGNEPDLLAYYPMSHLDGSTVTDKTGRGYNAVLKELVTGDTWVPFIAPISKLTGSAVTINKGAKVACAEYSTVSLNAQGEKVAIMRRFFAAPAEHHVYCLPDKRIEELELRWIGNGQFAPTLLGYIEGAPPIPSENLTVSDDYSKATSVELVTSEDVAFNWTRSQSSGLGTNTDVFSGYEEEVNAFAFALTKRLASAKKGFKGSLKQEYQFQNKSIITSRSSLNMSDRLELSGTAEKAPDFPHLGKRFVPKNIGYALVVSALADVFITQLKSTKRMIGYQVQPVENIPPDVNTITFLMNPAYTMAGSLDGLTGSSATSQRFFKHVPKMRAQYGSLYPASYYRLQEAYDIKGQIEQQDKTRESYFAQFNAQLVDEASLDRETNKGDAPGQISIDRAEDQPDEDLTEEEQEVASRAQQERIGQASKAAVTKQTEAEKRKREEIDAKITDQQKKTHAKAGFARWQRKMEDIQIRAGKRNIVNTYVWDADGGLRTEAQSFANTAQHSIGGSFSMNAALGYQGNFVGGSVAVELTAQATVSLTQTMAKTETRSNGIQLNVSLKGVEGKGITDYNDLPILPGEKVNRYRFMSFYLEGSTNNFHDFFNYVVNPEWLASNSEEARALRQARGKANKAWRVLHRVTYVERPALMGFGQDVRQLPPAVSEEEKQVALLKEKVTEMEKANDEMNRKLDHILDLLQNRES